jgi:hypothetical protein
MSDPSTTPTHKPQYLNKIVTPIGRISFPKLAKPDDQPMQGKPPDMKYKCALMIPKDAASFDAFKAQITAFAKQVFPQVTKKNYGNPITDGDVKAAAILAQHPGDEKAKQKAETYRGNWIIMAKSKNRPICVGVGGASDPIDPATILGGLNCRLKVSFCSYVGVDKMRDAEGNMTTVTTYGVTPLLEAVQLTGGGKPFGGGASADGLDAVAPGDLKTPAEEAGDL